ncbi:hypothetical protein TNCT_232081 [Trichonephila clavata]|uniref:Uncharacterized protein n=1 Tax=Trichonephila clavata TaxID=2740835 RepID=A0A8X6J2C3_TRICU|nr:hypothetical protein TNCT_232081 [Trichonephila clavata]
MIEIENVIPSNTSEMTQQLEEEDANLDEKIKNLEGKMSVLLPCPVSLCTHNFKYKSNNKRPAEPIIRPGKLNPKINPKNSKTENVKIMISKFLVRLRKTFQSKLITKYSNK